MEVTPAWACEVLCIYPFSWTTPWGEILAQISLVLASLSGRLSPLADYDDCSLTAPAEIGSFYLMVGAEIPNLILTGLI